MIAHKAKFFAGFGLMVGFIIVLVAIFSPIFNGNNGLDALDSLYNSISKGSAYYIPKIKKEAAAFNGTNVQMTLPMNGEKQAEQVAILLMKADIPVRTEGGSGLKVSGDLGKILASCLEDADIMYYNRGTEIEKKYGTDESRRVLFNWWTAGNAMEKELNKQKKFKEAKIVALVIKKAIEPSYNYYQIEPQKISERIGVVVFSLVFYVIYTLWYGFAILFMFEGWGLRLEH